MTQPANGGTDIDLHEDRVLDFLAALDEHAAAFPQPGINLLQAARLGRREIRHSNLLAFFLDPAEPHGLDDEFLHQLLRQAGAMAAPSVSGPPLSRLKRLLDGYADLQVRREMMNMDVVAWSDQQRFVLAIETKVDAAEGRDQLQRYRERLEQEFPGYEPQLLFLTPSGMPPSDDCWRAVAWSDVCDALEQARERRRGALGEAAVFAINQYLDFMRKEIVVNAVNEDLVKVCRELYTRHRQAIDLIIEYGAVSPFAEAARLFQENWTAPLQSYEVRPSAWAFLPAEIAAACDATGLAVAPGAKFWNQDRAIIMWFACENKKLALIVEVGPWPDARRPDLIEALRKEAPNKGKVKTAITDTYSRIWSTRREIAEDAGSDEVAGLMKEMLSVLDVSIPKFADVIRSVAGTGGAR